MYIYSSILLGLAAWATPVYALLHERSRAHAAAVSAALCAASLFLQIRYYELVILQNSWSELADMCHAEPTTARILLVAALALNLIADVLPKAGRKK